MSLSVRFPRLGIANPIVRLASIPRLAHYPITAWAALLLALAITAYGAYHMRQSTLRDAHARFQVESADIRTAISKRMAEYETVLRGGVGLFDISDGVQREQWRRYVDRLDIRRHYPGLQGLGFSQIIPATDLARHVAEVRAEGFPDYCVVPEGQRPSYAPTIYLEPFDKTNQRALGLDMYTEPVRREAMERARDSGQAAVSGSVILADETTRDLHRGFFIYLPIYRQGMPTDTVEQRRAALFGFVYSPVRVPELMQGILDASMAGLSIELYDGKVLDPSRRFYDSSGPQAHVNDAATRLFQQYTRLEIDGRTWGLRLHTLPGFLSVEAAKEPWIVAIGGALAGLLLFFSILTVSRRHREALAQAREMTHELRQSEARSRALVESAPDAIIVIDEQGVIETCNPAAQQLFGYSAEELLGRNTSVLIPGPEHDAHDRHIERFLATGESRIMGIGRDLQARRKDGSQVSINLNMGQVTGVAGGRRFIGFIRDLSDHKRQEETLERYRNHLEVMVAERTTELAAAQAHTQMILESVADGLIGIDPKGCFSFANPAACRMLGYTQMQLMGLPVHKTIHHSRPDGTPFPEAECHTIEDMFAGKAVRQENDVYWRADGSSFPVTVAAEPMMWNGEIVAGVVSFTDITERKRAEEELRRLNRALQAISASDRALMQATDETAYVREVCRIVVEDCGHVMAWTGYAEQDAEKSVRVVAHSGFEAGYLDILQLTWADTERGQGPVGTAIRTAQAAIYCDMINDPAFLPWREEAVMRGYTSSVALPLLADGAAFGALTIYSRLPDAFTAEDVKVLQELANDMAYGIVTLRLRAEHAQNMVALRESEVRYRTLATATFEGIVLSEQGRVVDCNDQFVDMVGYSREEIIGRLISDFVAPEDHERVSYNIQNDRNSYTEHEMVRKDKSRIIVEVNGRTVNNQGRATRLSTVHDITEHKLAERALRESVERYRFLYEQMQQGVIYLNADAHILGANPAAQRILGLSLTELQQLNVWDEHWRIVHEDGSPFAADANPVVQALVTGQPVRGVVMGVYSPARHDYVWINLQAVPQFQAGQSHPDQVHAVFEDITERKRSLAELNRARADAEQASRTKSAFLATMSHEIRTPMNGVLGMVEVLKRSHLTEHQSDLLKTIHDSGALLLNLIDDILDFSKIEAGRLEIGREPASLADIVEGLCSSMLPIATGKGVHLSLFVSPRIPEQVLTDDVRLRQVLYNLVGNAIKFSGGRQQRQGRVSVRAEVLESAPLRVAFRIADNGIGIGPETLGTLFTPFSQAEISTTRRFGGTGLGLAICKRLVDLMKGEIRAESAPAEGSTFTVELPFELPAEQPAPKMPILAGVACIVVQHPDYVADDIAAYLEAGGARVLQAADLDAGAQAAANLPAPVVLIQNAESRQTTPTVPHASAAMPHLRHLLITQGRRLQARQADPDTVSLDGSVLRRAALLRAVAVLAGRASPEVFHDATELRRDARLTPPGIAEARDQGRLILVAEDDAINQKVILAQLGLLGYAAEVADNGAKALNLWRAWPYALMLTDLHMPEMDGYTLAKTIRGEEAGTRRMPILALTANALRGEADHALAAGMDDFLTKPVTLELLRATLEKWMSVVHASSLPDAPRTKPTNAHAGAAVDVAVLKALVGDDEEIVREFLSDYLASARRLAADLQAACAAADTRQVGAIAHKLKSSSRSVGALALGELCAGLESAAKAGDNQGITDDSLRFDAALAEVDACIATLLTD